jgi:hypothetical protein
MNRSFAPHPFGAVFRFALLVAIGLGFSDRVARAAGEDGAIAAVKRADVARVEATVAGNVESLGRLLSEDLTYGHADGRIQTKADFIAAVGSNRVHYQAYDYLEAHMAAVGASVVTMTGRVRLKATAAGKEVAFTLRFLAVWRQEGSDWRLYAYQSAPIAE